MEDKEERVDPTGLRCAEVGLDPVEIVLGDDKPASGVQGHEHNINARQHHLRKGLRVTIGIVLGKGEMMLSLSGLRYPTHVKKMKVVSGEGLVPS